MDLAPKLKAIANDVYVTRHALLEAQAESGGIRDEWTSWIEWVVERLGDVERQLEDLT